MRLLDRVERVPEWVRPAVFGPLLLCYAILLRGGIIIVPLVLLLFIIERAEFVPVFISGAALFGLLLAASALGGLAYGVVGRPLRSVRRVGRYLAGIVAIAPYIAGVAAVVNATEGGSVLDPWDRVDWFIFAFVSVLFGLVIGHSWFEPEDPTR